MEELTSQVDLTPDPRVLRALTHTPLKPIDALCELIDNSLDSFQIAERSGAPIRGALVVIDVPVKSDLADGGGRVSVRDNGPGLSVASAEKALKAGFSGNNPFDTLGLFGMGFNIATGKIGTTTRFLTAIRDGGSELAAKITVDLPSMERSGHYNVPVERIAKPAAFEHGTLIEITGWWPAGNPNRDFIHKLSAIPKPKLREEIGRRYASVLRKGKIRIIVNNEDCRAFEHCVWSDQRAVEKQGWGRIPARFDFNELTGTQTRCDKCYRRIEDGGDCPECGVGTPKRTIEERVRGWVGVQRFDDADHFGIDLLRNGRAIRVLEKEAFFTFSDELGRKINDYPIDGPYGRIVGEVHLDHVAVDFMKQDFQRSSREWDDAMRFLRGASSLQPRQKGANENASPIFKLYQGYRRVRNVGKRDMYMGSWDREQGAGVRVSRELEREYYRKFVERAPGFYDDEEWWKLVEAADEAPVKGIKNCPGCGSHVLEEDEVCTICGDILVAKNCVECQQSIQFSALSCPQCGHSQIPEVAEPWSCNVCKDRNSADSVTCSGCGAAIGTKDPLSEGWLQGRAEPVAAYSLKGLTVALADGSNSQPVDLRVYRMTDKILAGRERVSVPCHVISDSSGLAIYFDPSHEAFGAGALDATTLIAGEAARRIFGDKLSLVSAHQGLHTIPRLTWLALQKLAPAEKASNLRERLLAFFADVAERLSAVGEGTVESMSSEMTETVMKQVVDAVQATGRSPLELPKMIADGSLAAFFPPDFIVSTLRKYPDLFFDGHVFTDSYKSLQHLPEAAALVVRNEVVRIYASCMDDCAQFIELRRTSKALEQRARYSLEYLERNLA